MTHAQYPLAGFINYSKGLRKDLVGERSDLLLKQLDTGSDRLVMLQLADMEITQLLLEHGKRQPNRVQSNGDSFAEDSSGLGSESSG